MALLTKMSQLGHYETIFTLGKCIRDVVYVVFDMVLQLCVGVLECFSCI